MAGEGEKEIIEIGADTSDFTESLLHATDQLKLLGSSENLKGLVEGIVRASALIGVFGAGLFAMKSAMDIVFDAEQIKAINAQFDMLTDKIGLAGDALKDKLISASGGLATETDLLKAANTAMIELGGSATHLGETMELARKITAAFGGDVVDRFEQLNRSFSTGNARSLRQVGIFLDQTKALKEFAKEHGVFVETLTLAGRQQAIMNAALKQGMEQFRGIDPNIRENTNLWKQFKVTMEEVGETASLVLGRTLGPMVKSMLTSVGGWAKESKLAMEAAFSDDKLKAASSRVEFLKIKVNDVEKAIASLSKNPASSSAFTSEGEHLEALKKSLQNYHQNLIAAKTELGKLHAKSGDEEGDETEKVDIANKEANKQRQLKFQAEMLAIRQQALQTEMQLDDTEKEAKDHLQEEITNTTEAHQIKRAEMESSFRERGLQDHAEAKAALLALDEQYENQKHLLEEQEDERVSAALERQVDESETTAEGMAAAFKAGAAKNKLALTDWGNTGRQVFDSFGKQSKQALLDFGSGTKSAADAAKGFLLGMIADAAEAKGMELLLEGIWPPNPLALGAGGALVALSGLLRSQANTGGGIGGSASVSAGGSAGSSGIQTVDNGTRTDTPPTLQQQQQKAVAIHISGSYFDTDSTRQRLTEMIREASDATDFTINKVGQ